ncbi:MAG TPA: hypothetical protein VEZ11_03015, partial [Thermoanaerobaculia bacterium]|nr:hypothetical protein [Thermoanaerobaculia bacterium]
DFIASDEESKSKAGDGDGDGDANGYGNGKATLLAGMPCCAGYGESKSKSGDGDANANDDGDERGGGTPEDLRRNLTAAAISLALFSRDHAHHEVAG